MIIKVKIGFAISAAEAVMFNTNQHFRLMNNVTNPLITSSCEHKLCPFSEAKTGQCHQDKKEGYYLTNYDVLQNNFLVKVYYIPHIAGCDPDDIIVF